MSAASASGLPALAGALRITPGAPPPQAVQSTRQDWATRMSHGVSTAQLPGRMASLFNLCGDAHRLCSQLAIDVAAPGLLPPPHAAAECLRRATAIEHIRRIGLDWPRLLATGARATSPAAALRQCPSLTPDDADPWPALRGWLHRALLQMPAADWLAAWEAGGTDWLGRWSPRHDHWLPALVHGARSADGDTALWPGTALRPQGDRAGLCLLGTMLAGDPAVALRPTWQGACAHTGPWSRLGRAAGDAPRTPWGLLGTRLAELARLAGEGGDACLDWGAVATGPHRGLAWVEMARGLLVHQVAIDPTAQRVQACQVVAPTEWNFHPHGEVAQRLARIDPGLPETVLTRRVHLLVAAFDPCVPFGIARTPLQEASHA